MFYNALKKIDSLLCDYLGIKSQQVKPLYLQINGLGVTVSSLDFSQRYPAPTSWENFLTFDIQHVDESDLAKLGAAIGKTIASDLTVSFSEVTYDKYTQNS